MFASKNIITMSLVYENIAKNVNSFYTLNKSINSINKDNGYIYNFILSVKISIKSLYNKYYYKKPRSSIKLINNMYYLSYVINGKCYNIILPCKYLNSNFIKKPSSNIIKINDKYSLSYNVNGINYNMVLPYNKNINDITKVVNENGTDITELFESYLGPCNNFHGFKYTPSTLGFDKIIIETIDFEYKTFNKDDVISL